MYVTRWRWLDKKGPEARPKKNKKINSHTHRAGEGMEDREEAEGENVGMDWGRMRCESGIKRSQSSCRSMKSKKKTKGK
jgi:hypothetical protein